MSGLLLQLPLLTVERVFGEVLYCLLSALIVNK